MLCFVTLRFTCLLTHSLLCAVLVLVLMCVCLFQATICTFRSVFAVKCGQSVVSIDWGLKALKAFGDVSREDYVLELPMIDMAVHVCEVLRRQGKDTEVAGLKEMLLKQCRVRDCGTIVAESSGCVSCIEC